MSQPSKSLRMSVVLLLLWLKQLIFNALALTRNKLALKIRSKNNQGYRVQGNLAHRLGIENQFLTADKIATSAPLSRSNEEDIFFDLDNSGITQTIRMFSVEDEQRITIEVLLKDEMEGVLVKTVLHHSLQPELSSLMNVDDRSWFKENHYQYQAW